MKNVLCAAILAMGVTVALSAGAADVSGTWLVNVAIGGQAPVDLTCAMKEADKKLTGSCQGAQFPQLAITGTTDGAKATWSYSVNYQGQDMTIVYNATVESATAMKGTVSVMGQESGQFTAKKQ